MATIGPFTAEQTQVHTARVRALSSERERSPSESDAIANRLAALREGLSELGYVEGLCRRAMSKVKI